MHFIFGVGSLTDLLFLTDFSVAFLLFPRQAVVPSADTDASLLFSSVCPSYWCLRLASTFRSLGLLVLSMFLMEVSNFAINP